MCIRDSPTPLPSAVAEVIVRFTISFFSKVILSLCHFMCIFSYNPIPLYFSIYSTIWQQLKHSIRTIHKNCTNIKLGIYFFVHSSYNMSIAVLSRHCSLNANRLVFQLKYRQSGMIFLTDKYTYQEWSGLL